MSEALRTRIQEQILRLQEELDALDKLEATESELLQAGEAYAKLLEEKEASTVRIRALEGELARLKAPPVKPEGPKPTDPAPKAADHKVSFTVKNDLDQPRVNEYVSVSVPLPQAWGVKTIDTLAVQGFPSGAGSPGLLLPADIRPIAWWPDKSIQSVVVEFRAKIPAKAEGRYELLVGVEKGTNPTPEDRLKVEWRTAKAHLQVFSGRQSFFVDIAGVMDGYGIISKDTGGLETNFEGKSVRQDQRSGQR